MSDELPYRIAMELVFLAATVAIVAYDRHARIVARRELARSWHEILRERLDRHRWLEPTDYGSSRRQVTATNSVACSSETNARSFPCPPCHGSPARPSN
jgi:hypothetical protein